jgi:2-polyprenyl-6-methoxyphenol hydroxylase-like FAD-dependent oxidoreductase
MAPAGATDVVIVGGGIGGSALALILARRGLDVIVLERQEVYRDRVRGEFLAPWGVAEARRLGIFDVLQSTGGVSGRWFLGYGDHVPREQARKDDLTAPSGDPPFCASHPATCRALSVAAIAAGARFVWNVSAFQVRSGCPPFVAYRSADGVGELRPRLVVGADGRASRVRRQIGLTLQQAQPTHLFTGMLVDDAAAWPQDSIANNTEGDIEFFLFPQGGQRVRLYTSTALDQRDRYAGSKGPQRFLEDFRHLTCLPQAESLGDARPIGPCATFDGGDTWIDVPLEEGVVLIGDAAGYNDPNIGQGLSLTLRDVRVVTEILLGATDWSVDQMLPYAEDRRERMRRVRFSAALAAAIGTTFGVEGTARRVRLRERRRDPNDPASLDFVPIFTAPEDMPAERFTEEFRAAVLG